MLTLWILLGAFLVVGVPASVWLACRLTVAMLVLDVRRELRNIEGRP